MSRIQSIENKNCEKVEKDDGQVKLHDTPGALGQAKNN